MKIRVLFITLAATVTFFQNCSFSENSYPTDESLLVTDVPVNSALNATKNISAEDCEKSDEICKLFLIDAQFSFYQQLTEVLSEIRKRSEADSSLFSYIKVANVEPLQTITLPRRVGRISSLEFSGLKNIIFDGSDALFVNANQNTFMVVNDCSNCIFRDFKVKQKKDLYTQGKITSIDTENLVITIRVDDGFQVLEFDEEVFGKNNIVVGKDHFSSVVFEQDGREWVPTRDYMHRPHLHIKKVHSLGGKELLVELDDVPKNIQRIRNFYDLKEVQGRGLKIAFSLPILDEDKLTVLGERSLANSGYIYLSHNRDIMLKNIHVDFSPTRAILGIGNKGQFHLHRVVLAPFNSKQLLSIINGGVIIQNNENFKMNRSKIVGCLDDMVNLLSTPSTLVSVEAIASGEYIIQLQVQKSLEKGVLIDEGDTLSYLDPLTGDTRSNAIRVLSVESREGNVHTLKVETEAVLEALSRTEEDDVEDLYGTRVFLDRMSQPDAMIKKSQFVRGARNGVICRKSCRISENQFRQIGLTAVLYGNREVKSGKQPVGSIPSSVEIIENLFRDIRRYPVRVSFSAPNTNSPVNSQFHYEITGNTFYDNSDSIILVENQKNKEKCESCKIRDNLYFDEDGAKRKKQFTPLAYH